jgi:hypothetical protein
MSPEFSPIIYLRYSVLSVEETDGDLHFLVAPVRGTVNHSVTRSGATWICTCSPLTSWQERDRLAGVLGSSRGNVCEHIARAFLYYRNMMARSDRMKKQVKTMAEEHRKIVEAMEEHGRQTKEFPLEAKRRIKLED